MEQRPIVWAPHGTTGRVRTSVRPERPGYWRPLYGYRSATRSLPLSAIEQPGEATWLRTWVKAHEEVQPLRLPFQLRNDGIRAGQGYLFKMPADFVERWTELSNLADELDDRAEELADRGSVPQATPTEPLRRFQPKSEADYTAIISAAVQHRTRTHEKLVRIAGEWLKARGAVIANLHPKDLEIISPVRIIVEAKVVRHRDALFAIREAVGQLCEYRYFIGPRNAAIAVLLDVQPSGTLITYAEDHLQVAVLWLLDASISGGPLAQRLILNSMNGIPNQ